MKPLEELPSSSRVWILPTRIPISPTSEGDLRRRLEGLVTEWRSHGDGVTSSAALRYGRFVVVAADQTEIMVSGCSIDKMSRNVEDALRDCGLEYSDNSRVYYKDNGEVRDASRQEFGELVKSGAVNGDTVVFDNSVTTLSDFLGGKWETVFRDSWHARAFP